MARYSETPAKAKKLGRVKRKNAAKKNWGNLAIKTRAWQALSQWVRINEPKCVLCGSPRNLAASHFIHNSDKPSKQFKGNALWFDVRNIHACCFACNFRKHGDLARYSLFLEELYGHGIIQELFALYKTERVYTREEIEAIPARFDL